MCFFSQSRICASLVIEPWTAVDADVCVVNEDTDGCLGGRGVRSAGEYSTVVGRGCIKAAAVEADVDAIVHCRLQVTMLITSIDVVVEHEGDATECDGGDNKIVSTIILLASSL